MEQLAALAATEGSVQSANAGLVFYRVMEAP